ncbi:MAG TPA: hypothetical protein DCS93_34375 [Microscillaceae bacterium]|nr:hypothetical protein [Microscillaceae bacterium]
MFKIDEFFPQVFIDVVNAPTKPFLNPKPSHRLAQHFASVAASRRGTLLVTALPRLFLPFWTTTFGEPTNGSSTKLMWGEAEGRKRGF